MPRIRYWPLALLALAATSWPAYAVEAPPFRPSPFTPENAPPPPPSIPFRPLDDELDPPRPTPSAPARPSASGAQNNPAPNNSGQQGPALLQPMRPAPLESHDDYYYEPAANGSYFDEGDCHDSVVNDGGCASPTIGSYGSCQACGSCGTCQPACGCCCGPTITAWADYLYVRRQQQGSQPLLLDNGSGASLLSSGGFNDGWESGIDTGVNYRLDCCNSVEFRYLWLDDWSAAAFVPNPGAAAIATSPATAPLLADFDVAARSELQTLELNLRQGDECLSWLVGFRYIELNEHLRLNGLPGDATLPSEARFNASNDLFGLQVGADAVLLDRGCWTLNGFVKAGLYYNRASAASSLTVDDELLGSGRGRADELAFFGELGVDGRYYLSRNVALRAGYRVMFVDGVATGSGALSDTGVLTSGAGQVPVNLQASDSILYHGFSGGLVVTW